LQTAGGAIATEKILAIVNPAAGGGRAVSVWDRVERQLTASGVRVEAMLTHRAGDGMALTAEARRDGYTTFAAVGGDGTVHEVVNGLVRGQGIDPACRVAVVPAGTGMDFARNVGMQRGVHAAAQRIIRGRERRFDVGFVPSVGRAFVNFMETGLGATVVAREARMSDRWPGRASFLLAAVGAAVSQRNIPVRVSADGQNVYCGPAVSVVVSNGRYFGGGMKIAPPALMDDGLLDLMILGDFRRVELIRQIWKIYPGVHVTLDKVLHVRARTVSVEAEGSGLLDLDGEVGGDPTCVAVNLPGALRLLI
jgi:YegS/Rv2252/BmrU family lipid kinase